MTTRPLELTVQQAAHGDVAAFESLVRRYANLVTSVALGVVRNVAESEDVAQDVFATVWTRLHQLKDPASFPTWLRQITRNQATEYLRTKARHGRIADATRNLGIWNDVAAERHALDAERQQLLDEALEELPDDARDAIVLYYREGNSVAQVAELLDLAPATVRKRMSRARAQLREGVQARLGEALRATAPGAAFLAATMAGMGPNSAYAATAAPSRSWGMARFVGIASVSAVLALLAVAWLPTLPDDVERASVPAAAEARVPQAPQGLALPPAASEEDRPEADALSWPPPPTSPYQEALFAYADAAGMAVVACDPALVPEGYTDQTPAALDEGQLWIETSTPTGGFPVHDPDSDQIIGTVTYEGAVIGARATCRYTPDPNPGVREDMRRMEAIMVDGVTYKVPPGFADALSARSLEQSLAKGTAMQDAYVAAVDIALEGDLSEAAKAHLRTRRGVLLDGPRRLQEELDALNPSEEAMIFVDELFERGGFPEESVVQGPFIVQ